MWRIRNYTPYKVGRGWRGTKMEGPGDWRREGCHGGHLDPIVVGVLREDDEGLLKASGGQTEVKVDHERLIATARRRPTLCRASAKHHPDGERQGHYSRNVRCHSLLRRPIA
jgi:hypothetical protein